MHDHFMVFCKFLQQETQPANEMAETGSNLIFDVKGLNDFAKLSL